MKQTLNIARLQKLPTYMPYYTYAAQTCYRHGAYILCMLGKLDWNQMLRLCVTCFFFLFLYINVSAGPISHCSLPIPNRSRTHKYIMFNIKCTASSMGFACCMPKWYIYKIAIWTTIHNMWRAARVEAMGGGGIVIGLLTIYMREKLGRTATHLF